MTYRVWLSQTYGNMGSAIPIDTKNEEEDTQKAIQLGYWEGIYNVRVIGKVYTTFGFTLLNRIREG